MMIKAKILGQRIDNFLMTQLKGLPKSRIYKAIRKGEVRVNKGRIKTDYRLKLGDCVRIPPLYIKPKIPTLYPRSSMVALLENRVIFESSTLMVLNKPAGIPVHGGSQVSSGIIELLRLMRPQHDFLELVHRLDRPTSGCLLIAKKRPVLLDLHEQIRARTLKKHYLALCFGPWNKGGCSLEAKLLKCRLSSGKKIVKVSQEGKIAKTLCKPKHIGQQLSLIDITLLTGRTHQIRVHLANEGYPIVGDEQYGNYALNHQAKKRGIKSMLLHSRSISALIEGQSMTFDAKLDHQWSKMRSFDGQFQMPC